jgi:hypothetical protein
MATVFPERKLMLLHTLADTQVTHLGSEEWLIH